MRYFIVDTYASFYEILIYLHKLAHTHPSLSLYMCVYIYIYVYVYIYNIYIYIYICVETSTTESMTNQTLGTGPRALGIGKNIKWVYALKKNARGVRYARIDPSRWGVMKEPIFVWHKILKN